ncbi:MAG: hypothetical protein OEU92_22000, partial [Alphaproteobacteria bacterium]|nr:hypothetical protein [Alphaproteobacteria bacterium]
SEYGLALDARERQALEDMIDEAQEIEEAARFNGAMGLADNEYALAMQMQERQALDDMIAKAKEMDVLADLPIPAFKPDLAFPAPPRPDDGPDMRGGDVAFGRGTVENGPGGKNVAYDGFDDWAADMRDMVNGNGPKEGVATPNEAETERQEAEKKEAEKKEEAETTNVGLKHEGGQNQGQQSDSVSNAGNNYGAPGDGIY